MNSKGSIESVEPDDLDISRVPVRVGRIGAEFTRGGRSSSGVDLPLETHADFAARLDRDGMTAKFASFVEYFRSRGMVEGVAEVEARGWFVVNGRAYAGLFPWSVVPIGGGEGMVSSESEVLGGLPRIPMSSSIEWVVENLERSGLSAGDAPSAYAWTLWKTSSKDSDSKRWFLQTYDSKRMPKVVSEGIGRMDDDARGIVELCDTLLKGIEDGEE